MDISFFVTHERPSAVFILFNSSTLYLSMHRRLSVLYWSKTWWTFIFILIPLHLQIWVPSTIKLFCEVLTAVTVKNTVFEKVEPSFRRNHLSPSDRAGVKYLKYGGSSTQRRVVTLYPIWDKLSVPSSRVKKSSWSFKLGLIGCPEASVQNCHSTLRNIPELHRSHLHRGGCLKTRKLAVGCSENNTNFTALCGARGGAVAWGTALQTGWSRVRFPTVPLT
jgi:hypothetical protein